MLRRNYQCYKLVLPQAFWLPIQKNERTNCRGEDEGKTNPRKSPKSMG